jgi:putative ABC transport system substrate-binding protein
MFVLGSALPRAAEPEHKVVRVGLLHPQSPTTVTRGVNSFWERLRQLGYVEGQNLAIETRWAEGRYDRLPALAAELAGLKVDVLVTYSTPAAIAAKNATSTVPIVAVGVADPIRSGLSVSLARPSSNVTGLSAGWDNAMAGKWLELLQETVPGLARVAVVANPDNPAYYVSTVIQFTDQQPFGAKSTPTTKPKTTTTKPKPTTTTTNAQWCA